MNQTYYIVTEMNGAYYHTLPLTSLSDLGIALALRERYATHVVSVGNN